MTNSPNFFSEMIEVFPIHLSPIQHCWKVGKYLNCLPAVLWNESAYLAVGIIEQKKGQMGCVRNFVLFKRKPNGPPFPCFKPQSALGAILPSVSNYPPQPLATYAAR